MKKEIRCYKPSVISEDTLNGLKSTLPLSKPIIQILLNRGYTELQEIKDFLTPSLSQLHNPFLFSNMERATDRIYRALKEKEMIVIYGDYDVDGVTSIALLTKNLSNLSGNVLYYIPHRIKEGYGVSEKGIKTILDKGGKLIITVDCGINAINEVKFAAQNGIDVIITDHHIPKVIVNDAYAIINPKSEGEKYPFKELAGVGVAFKLIEAVYRRFGENIEDKLYNDLDLVALGTIADLVPLIGENRILARKGLEFLNKTEKVGINALINKTKLRKGDIGTYEIGYILGPRLNASGRLDTAMRSVELLLTSDRSRAWEFAEFLDRSNRLRQSLHEKVIKDSIRIVEDKKYDKELGGIVIARDDWHEGVVGIAASKIAEKYTRPTILISTAGEVGKGSGRSVKSFSLLDALNRCKEYLSKYGGHRYAAGITIEKDKIANFRDAFNEIVKEQLKEDDLIPEIHADSIIDFDEIDNDLLSQMKQLEPFGIKNPEPVFLTEKVDFVGFPKIVGNNHLKTKVRQNGVVLEAIGFGKGDVMDEIEIGKTQYNIYFKIKENFFRGRKKLQLHLVHIQKFE